MIYESACVPSVDGPEADFSSADVSSELDLWEPMENYSTDDWFSITPPTVSQEDQEIYRKACEVVERGTKPVVPTESLELYAKHIKQWCDT